MLPSTQVLGPATPDGAAPADAGAAADDEPPAAADGELLLPPQAATNMAVAKAIALRRLADEMINVLPPAGPAVAEPSGRDVVFHMERSGCGVNGP
jgi:hypothetical protein